VQRITANGADAFVPAIGEVLPNFLMMDAKGHLVDHPPAQSGAVGKNWLLKFRARRHAKLPLSAAISV
jgi:hypothetical protein